MAFPETPAHSSTGQPASERACVRAFDGVCLCGTAEVIISGGGRAEGGAFLSLLLRRVEPSRAGTPSWSVSTHPPTPPTPAVP